MISDVQVREYFIPGKVRNFKLIHLSAWYFMHGRFLLNKFYISINILLKFEPIPGISFPTMPTILPLLRSSEHWVWKREEQKTENLKFSTTDLLVFCIYFCTVSKTRLVQKCFKFNTKIQNTQPRSWSSQACQNLIFRNNFARKNDTCNILWYIFA